MLRGLVQAQAAQAEILRQVTKQFDQYPLQIQVQQTYDLATAAQAHRDLEAGSLMGKLVLDLASSP
jgi:NADPH2:quinone reductase